METERLILRRWQESDAESLFEYAREPEIGYDTGWQPHKSIEESRNIIAEYLSRGEECYAICLKEDNKAIGTAELKLKDRSSHTDRDDECELGFWLGKPFWGRGIMPEAVQALLHRAFEELGMTRVWCAYYEGNDKSKRVQEKCGFVYEKRNDNADVPLLGEKRNEIVNAMTKDQWSEFYR